MPAADTAPSRRAKGTNLSQLVPFLRKRRKARPFAPLSPAAEKLMEERIIESRWYPFDPFVELLRIVDKEVLRGSEELALGMGVVGGKQALLGTHKAFVTVGDPLGSAMAMRHSWRAYFDFGELRAVADNDRQVTLTLTGYSDVIMVHGGMIAGWGAAAAQLAGAADAKATLLEKPWEGAPRMVYRVTF